MSGWKWFWTLVGYLIYILVLIFLYFYDPFEDLFNLVVNGLSYENSIFWAVLIISIIGFCGYHWRAYRIHIIQRRSVEGMVLASLKGSTFTAILLSAGATLQAVQIMCAYLLDNQSTLGSEFGSRLAAIVALVILTGAFSIIFWILRLVRPNSDNMTSRHSH